MYTFYTSEETDDILVVDRDGDVIGAIARLLVDPAGKPRWVTIRSDIYGPKETFVPYHGARWMGGNLHVSVSKYLTTEAPYIAVSDDGPLTTGEVIALYRHYELPVPADVTTGPGSIAPAPPSGPEHDPGEDGVHRRDQ
ncbi:hypothetical protein [Cryobacterium sp. GrIS_2_6]|uniref:hypothetical protein n=1 Tax=Cryobacterium sp. GrIS_2_6 TaxID=3162785 RepID=UPI002E06DF7E|nr:hypothetical protein [Cryobacterium psychrotolerans]